MTTRRHDHSALQRLLERGSRVGVISVQDRFSERETIGLVIVTRLKDSAEIDTLLLSCRVLGRGIEQAAITWAARSARAMGARELVGVRIPTERNQPTAGLYEELGFSAHESVQEGLEGTEMWILHLQDNALGYPDWMAVDERA
jgi:FkbH-like protein